MEIIVERKWREGNSTIGTMKVDGVAFGYTLEDVVRTVDPSIPDAEEIRRVKIPGETAIPAGKYRVALHDSPKFGRVPKIHNVPGFSDILIHAGNRAADTRGCLLVGFIRLLGAIGASRDALRLLVDRMESAGGEATIDIRDAWAGG